MVPPPPQDNLRDLEPKWFTQLVDHFDNTNLATWKQRYYENTELIRPITKPNFPIFVYIGSEGPLSSRWLTQGLMYEYANKTGAMMLALEHRFYGVSQPRGDHSTRNLSYLSTSQALADLAYFIKAQGYSDHPYVVFGGSYGGTLAAFARLKYPHLIHAAIASSAPLDPRIDFTDYVKVMEYAFNKYGGETCVNAMRNARDKVINLFNSDQGANVLTKRLQLCDPLSAKNKLAPLDQLNFWGTLSDTIASVVQYNKEGGEVAGLLTVRELCKTLTAAADPLEGYFNMFERMRVKNGDKCLSWTYKSMLADLSDTAINPSNSMRQWMWQTCSEYGFYQITNESIFTAPFDLSLFDAMCSDAYGPGYNMRSLEQNVIRTNSTFGGRDVRQTNVIYTNGDVDPWSALSVVENKKRPVKINAWMTPGTSHCAILYADQPYDVPQLSMVRQQVFYQLSEMLEQFYSGV